MHTLNPMHIQVFVVGNSPIRKYESKEKANIPKENHSFLHNHAHAPGSMCGVFYLNIPRDGGEILFENKPMLEGLYIKPQIDNVYLFPIWLAHKAMPHTSGDFRICFNWTYGGNVRPMYKLTGDIW